MAETGIRFMTFGISPYCEKARWALDWHRIRYREIGWPPGLHQILAKRCGAKTSALPILSEGTTVIQGSSAIIDWAERRAEDHARSLAPSNGAGETQEIERRSNEITAVHVRRLAFAEMLPNYAHFVKPGMFERASGWHRLAGHIMWPVAVRIMMRGYDLGPGAAAESRATSLPSSTGSTRNLPMAAPILQESASAARIYRGKRACRLCPAEGNADVP